MSTVICPKCGKSLVVESSDEKFIFCEYCGTKVNINVNYNFNYNYSKSEHTEHIIDDAKIKAAENVNRVIGVFASPFEERRKAKEEQKRKEEEEARKREEAQREAQERARIRNAKIAAFCKAHPKELLITLVASCIALFAGISLWNVSNARQAELAAHQAELARLEEEKIANSHLAIGEVKMPDFSKTGDYRNVVKALKDAGFTNITAEGKGDMLLGIFETENYIDEITVDGAPEFETNTWYKMDTPIVITYHSFHIAASSAIEEVSTSETEDFCYEEVADDATVYIWGTPSESIVRFVFAYPNNVSVCFIGRITSGTLTDGCTVRFDYTSDDGDKVGFEYKLRLHNNQLYIDFGDGSEGVTTNTVSLDTIENLRHGIWIELPEGCNPTEVLNKYTTTSSSSASSTTEDGLASAGLTMEDLIEAAQETETSTSSEPEYNYAYCIHFGDYAMYYLFDFDSGEVRCFTYGNGSTDAYVGHITEGSRSKGCTVHYNYNPGWDEKMTFTQSTMTVTGADGYKTEFSKAPLNATKSIYRRYHDMR